MMENRSFDHFLGWLPGADGKQAGLTFTDRYGVPHDTHHLTAFDSCGFNDPDHSWEGGRIQLNDGKCDGFLRSGRNDELAIGYYAAGRPAVLRARRAGLDDLRPLLLRGDGRDLPQPLLHARRPDRPDPQQHQPVEAPDDLGPARRQGRQRHLLLQRRALHRALVRQVRRHLQALRRSSSPTPRPGRSGRVVRRPPVPGRGVRHLQRRPPARRHPRRPGVPQPGLRRRPRRPGLGEDRAGHQLRRVGRLLRPRARRSHAPDAIGEDLAARASGCRR